MKGQGGGGTAKGGGKTRSGGGSVKITRTEERKTKELEGKIITLRAALFEDNGKDKDVTKDLAPAFMKFDRNGLNCTIELAFSLDDDVLEWAFNLCKDTMEERYDASGYGWDDDDKMDSFQEKGTRFLIVRDVGWETPVAFAHFRFSVQGEVMDVMQGETTLCLWDIHVEESHQRKGLGKHLLTILELIARKQKIKTMTFPVQLKDEVANSFIGKIRGFAPDDSLKELVGFDAEVEGFQVFCKHLVPPPSKAAAAGVATAEAQLCQQQPTKESLDAAVQALSNPRTAVKTENIEIPPPPPTTTSSLPPVPAPTPGPSTPPSNSQARKQLAGDNALTPSSVTTISSPNNGNNDSKDKEAPRSPGDSEWVVVSAPSTPEK